jgi:hypothetical protein
MACLGGLSEQLNTPIQYFLERQCSSLALAEALSGIPMCANPSQALKIVMTG